MLKEIRGQISTLDLESASGYGFRAGNSTIVFLGEMAVFPESKDGDDCEMLRAHGWWEEAALWP